MAADVICVALLLSTVLGCYVFQAVPQTVGQWRTLTVTFTWIYWCLPGATFVLSH